jgi:CelD/BcsL family acetyltransferase involved in cellulose biosynthesis
VAQGIAQWLVNSVGDADNSWDHLQLDGVATTDATMAHLVATLSELGCTCHRQPGLNCWRLPLAESWDAMLGQMSKNRRKLVRRWQRDLEVESVAQRFTVTRADELPHAMRILVDLHQRRRKTLNEPGCFASTQFSGFLHDVAEKLLAIGALRMSWLEAGGQPIAVEFKVKGGETLYAYQSGIEPNAMHLSPGNLITTADLKAAVEEGWRHYDFLRGDEEYKALWGATPHGTHCLRIAANRLAPRLQHGLWLAGFTMKNWVKSGLTLTGMN